MNTPRTALLLASVCTLASACVETKSDTLSASEELEVIQAAVHAQRTEAFAGEVVELTTGFTIGEKAKDTAKNLEEWVVSQLPCSVVSSERGEDDVFVVHMDLGGLDDACELDGRTFAGALSISIVDVDPAGRVVLEHDWQGVTDGELSLTGQAVVTWDATLGPITRDVVYGGSWDSAAGVLVAEGTLLQSPLVGDTFAEGLVIDGVRDWTAEDGQMWGMVIEGVEARWQDPVPQAGHYIVTTPVGKVATLSFARQDEDTIRVVLAGGEADRVFDVTALGIVREVEAEAPVDEEEDPMEEADPVEGEDPGDAEDESAM